MTQFFIMIYASNQSITVTLLKLLIHAQKNSLKCNAMWNKMVQ